MVPSYWISAVIEDEVRLAVGSRFLDLGNSHWAKIVKLG